MDLEVIQLEVSNQLGIEASTSTFSRLLNDMGNIVTPTWALILTAKHIKECLKYFNEYIRWNYGFRNVIFIDEPRGSDFSVMVWGSICYSENIYLETVDGRLNGESYLDILERFTEEVDESFNRTQS